MIAYTRIKLFFRSIYNGLVGISFEILLAGLFILAGFLVSMLWWSAFR